MQHPQVSETNERVRVDPLDLIVASFEIQQFVQMLESVLIDGTEIVFGEIEVA